MKVACLSINMCCDWSLHTNTGYLAMNFSFSSRITHKIKKMFFYIGRGRSRRSLGEGDSHEMSMCFSVVYKYYLYNIFSSVDLL